MTTMHSRPRERSFPQLFTDTVSGITQLFQTEIRLARAEITEKLSQTAAGAGLVATGGALALAALVILLQAIVAMIVEAGLEAYWAALIVAVVAGLAGFLLVRAGMSRMSPSNLTPERTINSLQQDVNVAKEHVR